MYYDLRTLYALRGPRPTRAAAASLLYLFAPPQVAIDARLGASIRPAEDAYILTFEGKDTRLDPVRGLGDKVLDKGRVAHGRCRRIDATWDDGKRLLVAQGEVDDAFCRTISMHTCN